MYDVLVIGGGPGGYAAAIRASQLGGKVALAEYGDLGGVCVHKGCIPSKTWLHAAWLLRQMQEGEKFGLKVDPPKPDFAMIRARKSGVANDIGMGMKSLLGNNQVDVLEGKAILESPNKVEVNGKVHETKSVILATGSSLDIPDMPGLEDVAMTTDQVMDMEKLPESILIPGNAGPIEVEMACLLAALGSKVYLLCSKNRILPNEDTDTSQRLAQGLREQGVEILPHHSLQKIVSQNDGCKVLLAAPKEEIVEYEVKRVLVSSRKPNSSGIGLEKVGIELDENGFVKVDKFLETSCKGIFAIGDVVGGTMLSHASSSMAIPAAENAMGQTQVFKSHLVPKVLWTMPQVASVGLSEDQAEDLDYDVELGEFPYAINGLAMVRDEVSGSVRIVTDSEHGEILGVHIVGANATDLIGEAILAMQLECTANELARSLRPHPTFSETIVDAARDVNGWALYLPRG